MGKTVRVSDETYRALDAIRKEKGLKSFNAVISSLLEGKKKLDGGHSREDLPEIPSKCPYCGHPLANGLQEPHILLGGLGIEIYFRACPMCMRPLSEIRWKAL